MAKLDLHIGAHVYCTDQQWGKLVNLVVYPQTHQVTELVVAKGLLLKQDRVIPLASVERVTETALYLTLPSQEVSSSPVYSTVELKQPAPDARAYASAPLLSLEFGTIREPVVPMLGKRVHPGIGSSKAVIGHGTAVSNVRSVFGYLDHVVVDTPTGRMSDLVLRRGLFPEYVVIPAERVQDLSEQEVLVAVTTAEFADLPRYQPQPDAEILAELHDQLNDLLPSPFASVTASVAGGVVRLTGYVHSPTLCTTAEERVRAIAGVLAVQNEVQIDPELA